DIAALERFGEKSAENIVGEVAAKKRVPLARFLYALGILHVGEETAALLSKSFDFPHAHGKILVKDILKVFEKLSFEDLQEVQDIGPKVGKSIYEWFRESRNKKFLERLEKAGVEVTAEPRTAAKGKLVGKTFVLTGTLETMGREEAKEKIRAMGGDASES